MKIAHVIPFHLQKMGGLQVFVHNLAKHQVKQGHDVWVLTHSYPGDVSDYPYKLIKIGKIKGGMRFFFIYKFIAGIYLYWLQKIHNFDVWQVNGGYPYGVLLPDFFNRNKIPSILRCSGDDIQVSYEHHYGVRRIPKINRLIQENYQKFSTAVAITNVVSDEYRNLNVPLERIEIIPNGVDIQRISNNNSMFDIRERHQIGENSKIILSVGRHHPKKNYEIIPKILTSLIKENLDVYWIVIGDDTERILSQYSEQSLTDRVILIDELKQENNERIEVPSSQLIEYYKQSDIFAMTSSLETFGIVLIEAMAAALPIICFNAPGISDVMTEKCGYMCKLGDANEFTHYLKKMVKGDNSNFSMHSYERAKDFDWSLVSEKYIQKYKELLDHKEYEK